MMSDLLTPRGGLRRGPMTTPHRSAELKPTGSARTGIALLSAIMIVLIVGCSGVERAAPRPEPARVNNPGFDIDVPRILRGTVASEAILEGYQPVVVRGYGLVVGLDGTGSRELPPQVRAHMLAEMGRRGIGSERDGYGEIKPEQMLDSLDTAVVIVEAVIPPGAVGRVRTGPERGMPGTRFDVRIYADPRTGTTSLEGGRLYTTDLRPGPLRPGGRQARAIAQAGGPIFINPFAEPGAVESNTVTRTIGMILNGGEVLQDIPLRLRLANPSHSRASGLQTAINGRFTQERGQREPTARGESDSTIYITVPPSFRDDPEEFITLLKHTTLRLGDPEAVAVSVRRALLSDPSLAWEASWRWQALGKRALPIVKELYDHPEELPRLAALRAGAKLNDPLVVPHLIDLAHGSRSDLRQESIELLAGMDTNPRIDRALRELLNDSEVDVRLAAYEALVKRGDPYMQRMAVNRKFVLDVIDSDEPMIYVTQFGQPRIAIFGRDLEIERPIFVQAWSNRLMLKESDENGNLEVYFRHNSTDVQGVIHEVEPKLHRFIRFLGHSSSPEEPEPGLGLSYGETVGALHQIWSRNYIKADFKAEQDRILAAILRTEEDSAVVERPEFADPDSEWLELELQPEDDLRPRSDLERLSPSSIPGQSPGVPRRGGSGN